VRRIYQEIGLRSRTALAAVAVQFRTSKQAERVRQPGSPLSRMRAAGSVRHGELQQSVVNAMGTWPKRAVYNVPHMFVPTVS
jgi:hypothetical protein